MIRRISRCILRQIANNCIVPELRMFLLRLSGIAIGNKAFVNMGITFIDNYRGGVIKIGDRVSIAPAAVFVADSDANNSRLRKIQSFHIRGKITIGDDSWIGAGALVLPNVEIGKFVVIGAAAVVTKNVDDYSIMAGNPARKIGDVRDYNGWNAQSEDIVSGKKSCSTDHQ